MSCGAYRPRTLVIPAMAATAAPGSTPSVAAVATANRALPRVQRPVVPSWRSAEPDGPWIVSPCSDQAATGRWRPQFGQDQSSAPVNVMVAARQRGQTIASSGQVMPPATQQTSGASLTASTTSG